MGRAQSRYRRRWGEPSPRADVTWGEAMGKPGCDRRALRRRGPRGRPMRQWRMALMPHARARRRRPSSSLRGRAPAARNMHACVHTYDGRLPSLLPLCCRAPPSQAKPSVRTSACARACACRWVRVMEPRASHRLCERVESRCRWRQRCTWELCAHRAEWRDKAMSRRSRAACTGSHRSHCSNTLKSNTLKSDALDL